MGPLRRALLKSLLLSAVKQHRAAGRPQLAGLAFDHVTAKIHLDGRFADWELNALESALFPRLARGTALDIGANIGNHSVAFAPHFNAVHAFEPNPRALDLLKINAKLRDNITIHDFGLSDRAQSLSVTEPEGNLGGTGAGAKGEGRAVALPLRRLDDAVSELGETGPITFAKIDVEGHEAEVIAGGKDTFGAHQPVLGLEINRHDISGGTCSAVEAARALGYSSLYSVSRSGISRINRLKRQNYPLVIATARDELSP